jgi:hypothetical protein
MVLAPLHQHSLVVNPDKCSFDVTKIDFLGHIGVSMDPMKSNAVTSWQVPKSVKDIQVFLGFDVTSGNLPHSCTRLRYPCTFFSRKMNPAEINYNIHDKELLAIVKSLHAWHHYVVSIPADEPLTILSDHKNLARFSSKLSFSCRQFH